LQFLAKFTFNFNPNRILLVGLDSVFFVKRRVEGVIEITHRFHGV